MLIVCEMRYFSKEKVYKRQTENQYNISKFQFIIPSFCTSLFYKVILDKVSSIYLSSGINYY